MVCTGFGFLTGGSGRPSPRTVAPRGSVVPLGLVVVSVVAGVWEFATSGLEMSMVFLWLGTSFFLLVGTEVRRTRAWPAAVVMGLGTLIRPELALGSVVFLAGLLVVVAAPGWSAPAAGSVVTACPSWPRAGPAGALSSCSGWRTSPCSCPTPALAKAGGSAWWSQGFTYLWNFVAPYTLWLPLALVRSPSWHCVCQGGGGGGTGSGWSCSPRPWWSGAGRRGLRGPPGRRLHARPAAPARVLRRVPAHLRAGPPGPGVAGRPPGR